MENKMSQVFISDCTLLEAADQFELSFREKIELCRIIDKLGVSAVNLNMIRQKKIDRLLVKSISSAVRNAAVAVPVDLADKDSVPVTWEALKEAARPRLQVAAPVSSVQMEYLLHMKADMVMSRVEEKIRSCRALTENVEFIAEDATRSDPAFLRRILAAAVSAGASVITLCDTAGVMMPEEVSGWIAGLQKDLPELERIVIGFFSIARCPPEND